MKNKEICIKVANAVFKLIIPCDAFEIYSQRLKNMIVSPVNSPGFPVRDEVYLKGRTGLFSLIDLIVRSLKEDYLFFHASGIENNNRALIFVGPSDRGKTTAFLFGIMSGYRGLCDDILLYSLKDDFIYPLQFKLNRYLMLPYFEAIFNQKANLRYTQKAKISKIFLLQKSNFKLASDKIFFLYHNCHNSFIDRERTLKKIITLVKKRNNDIKFISPLNVFNNLNQTNQILQKILTVCTEKPY